MCEYEKVQGEKMDGAKFPLELIIGSYQELEVFYVLLEGVKLNGD